MLLIGALLMSIMVPNLSALRSRALRQQADQLVAQIDLARQRSVVTGVPHRLILDLDAGAYGLEWHQRSEVLDDEPSGEWLEAPLSLTAPPAERTEFARLPGLLGRVERLADDIEISGVETPGGWVEGGVAHVSFGRDGTASFTTIVLADLDGRRLFLEILPLADRVRIIDEAL